MNLGKDKSVAYLAEEAAKKLERDLQPSAVTLHLAKLDSKGEVIGETKEALDARKSLAEAGLSSGASIVVKVAGAAATPSRTGELARSQ